MLPRQDLIVPMLALFPLRRFPRRHRALALVAICSLRAPVAMATILVCIMTTTCIGMTTLEENDR